MNEASSVPAAAHQTWSTPPLAPEPSTSALMGRYCDGDRAAFDALYRQLARPVLARLMRLTGERARAEDLLQLTFLKLHEARSSYVRGADPLPWIMTIARRTFIDDERSRRRARVLLSNDGVLPEGAAAELDGGQSADGQDTTDARGSAARAALARLPARQKQVLWLTKVEGLSLAEVAALTGTTMGALKLRAHRGYTTLRRLLGAPNRLTA